MEAEDAKSKASAVVIETPDDYDDSDSNLDIDILDVEADISSKLDNIDPVAKSKYKMPQTWQEYQFLQGQIAELGKRKVRNFRLHAQSCMLRTSCCRSSR